MAMPHASVARKIVCPLRNLRKGKVACHYRFTPSCRVTKAHCHMSILRNGHVAISNLVVQTHDMGGIEGGRGRRREGERLGGGGGGTGEGGRGRTYRTYTYRRKIVMWLGLL